MVSAKGNFTLFALILTSSIVHAQQVNKEDLKLLPPYCKGTQLIRNVSGDTTPLGEYIKLYGNDFMHLHHFCWALNTENQYYRNPTSSYWKGMLIYAIGDLDYVIKNSGPTFVFLPDIHLAKARIYSLQKQNGQAISSALKAIEIKPDFVRAYIFVSDLYITLGNKANAIKILKSALVHTPESTPIRRRLVQLGVTPPKIDASAAKSNGDIQPPAPAIETAPAVDAAKNAPQDSALPEPDQQSPNATPTTQPATQQDAGQPANNPYCRFCP